MSTWVHRIGYPATHRAANHPSDITRWLIVGSLAVTAVAPIPLTAEHLSEAPYMGVLFIAFTMAVLAAAGALVLRPSVLRYAAAAGLCATGVATYAATRLVAFPQLAEDVGAWTEPLGVLSIVAETVVVVMAVWKLRQLAGAPADGQHRVAGWTHGEFFFDKLR